MNISQLVASRKGGNRISKYFTVVYYGPTQCAYFYKFPAPMEEVSEEGIQPVSSVREAFEPKKSPRTADQPTASPKLQRPSAFVQQPTTPQRYSEQMDIEIAGKELPPFEKRIPLFQKEQVAPVASKTPEKPLTKRIQPKFVKVSVWMSIL